MSEGIVPAATAALTGDEGNKPRKTLVTSSSGGGAKSIKRPAQKAAAKAAQRNKVIREPRVIARDNLDKATKNLAEAQAKMIVTLNREYSKDIKSTCITQDMIKMMDRIYKIVRDRISTDTVVMQQTYGGGDDVVFRIHFQHGQKTKTMDTLETLYISGQLVDTGRFCLLIYTEDEVNDDTAHELKSRHGMLQFLAFVDRACSGTTAVAEGFEFTDAQLTLLYEMSVVALMHDVCNRSTYLNANFEGMAFIDATIIKQYMLQTL
jgi:hypothetical protein